MPYKRQAWLHIRTSFSVLTPNSVRASLKDSLERQQHGLYGLRRENLIIPIPTDQIPLTFPKIISPLA